MATAAVLLVVSATCAAVAVPVLTVGPLVRSVCCRMVGWLMVSTERVLAYGCCVCTQNFKSIKSRGAIQQQMMNKLVDTLEQFLREVIAAQEMFDRCKANPPLTRNQPPVAGGSAGRCCAC